MKHATYVFQRLEKKYIVDAHSAKLLYDMVQDKMAPDQFGQSTIYNLYFDTPDNLLIRRSIEGPKYKEKLRLRSYGLPAGPDAKVYLELKKKFSGVVFKRRAALALGEVEAFCAGQTEENGQIQKELGYALRHYGELKPAMHISHDRLALVGRDDPELRLTFDANITWRQQQLDLTKEGFGKRLLEPGVFIMEIKVPGAMPMWLSALLSELAIFPASFSKYGNCYAQAQKNKLVYTGGLSYAG